METLTANRRWTKLNTAPRMLVELKDGTNGLKHSALVDAGLRFRKARKPDRRQLDERFADEARFFRSWVDSPGLMGAVSPSSRFLTRAMARCVDPGARGLVIELGPGTGPVTEALIDRGVAPERLVLVEYAPAFCKLLQKRFPRSRIVRGDAYNLRDTLAEFADQPVNAVVSSLPLLNRPDAARLTLLEQAFDLMGPDGLFVQYTYGIASPIPVADEGGCPAFMADADKPVWLNLPPARVWRYRRADHYARSVEQRRSHALDFKRELSPFLEAFGQKQVAPALALLRKMAEGPNGSKGVRR